MMLLLRAQHPSAMDQGGRMGKKILDDFSKSLQQNECKATHLNVFAYLKKNHFLFRYYIFFILRLYCHLWHSTWFVKSNVIVRKQCTNGPPETDIATKRH